jgi:hypothetical protein
MENDGIVRIDSSFRFRELVIVYSVDLELDSRLQRNYRLETQLSCSCSAIFRRHTVKFCHLHFA